MTETTTWRRTLGATALATALTAGAAAAQTLPLTPLADDDQRSF